MGDGKGLCPYIVFLYRIWRCHAIWLHSQQELSNQFKHTETKIGEKSLFDFFFLCWDECSLTSSSLSCFPLPSAKITGVPSSSKDRDRRPCCPSGRQCVNAKAMAGFSGSLSIWFTCLYHTFDRWKHVCQLYSSPQGNDACQWFKKHILC